MILLRLYVLDCAYSVESLIQVSFVVPAVIIRHGTFHSRQEAQLTSSFKSSCPESCTCLRELVQDFPQPEDGHIPSGL